MTIEQIKKNRHDLISDLSSIFHAMDLLITLEELPKETAHILRLIVDKKEQVFSNTKILADLAQKKIN